MSASTTTDASVSLARAASLSCLAVFVIVGPLKPLMSGFATLLGIGFPIVLLLFLRWRGGNDQPSAVMA